MNRLLKKISIGITVGALSVLSAGYGANVFAKASPLERARDGFEINTHDINGDGEIYEFTPPTAPHKTCVVFMIYSRQSVTMQCFDKSED